MSEEKRYRYQVVISLEKQELDHIGDPFGMPKAEVMRDREVCRSEDMVTASSLYEDLQSILDILVHLKLWQGKESK